MVTRNELQDEITELEIKLEQAKRQLILLKNQTEFKVGDKVSIDFDGLPNTPYEGYVTSVCEDETLWINDKYWRDKDCVTLVARVIREEVQ